MTRSSLLALGAGVASALLYLTILSGSPFALALAYFSQTPLFLVGLSLGLAPAAIACGIAAVGLVAATQVATAGLFVLLSVLPVVYIVRYGLLSRPGANGTVEWYPPGMLLAGLTAYGFGLLLLAALLYLGEPGGIEAASRRFLVQFLNIPSEADSAGAAGPTLELMADLFPGAAVASAMIMIVVNAAFAQGALFRAGKSLRPSPDYGAVALPRWPVIALGIAAVCAFLPDTIGFLGRNAVLIAGVPFALVGLAVLHAVSRRWPARGLALGLIYVTTIMLGWPAIIVAGIGVIDHWSPLRPTGGGPAKRPKEDD